MATRGKTSQASGQSNKFRLVMVDADMSDGSIGEMVVALTAAFRPAQNVRVFERTALKDAAGPSMNGHQDDVQLEGRGEEADQADTDDPVQHASQPSKPRRHPLPTYLHDLDIVGTGTSLKDFVATHQSNKHLRRYLIACYWLKHHGGRESVNVNVMYTVYRTVGWQPNINDWDANFRSLVQSNKLRRVSAGEYTITPIGEAEVQTASAEKG